MSSSASRFTDSRSTPDEIQNENQLIRSDSYVNQFMEALPEVIVIINANRQIVFYNQHLLTLLNANKNQEILGKRTGEVFQCQNIDKEQEGCGTNECCQFCGAFTAITESLKNSHQVTRECKITSLVENQQISYDFKVTTTPFEIKDRTFTLISFIDISHQKRRSALERIFFHDILNTASSLKCFIELLKKSTNEEDKTRFLNGIENINSRLIEEINNQKLLVSAEAGSLTVNKYLILSDEIVEEVIEAFYQDNIAKNKDIIIAPESNRFSFVCDATILKRILTNLIKNALEATQSGSAITIRYITSNDQAIFSIHNQCYIPRDIRMQIFLRSFSTKGEDRGLGTYSVKLLTEQYLKGSVKLDSSEEKGTTFTVILPT
ncbi:MAG: HAMP domain-containing histidine kinase [Spirochaetes bacterium]|nr:HAMP domain-containing histidine kinase [Spirochaetota bacterium]